MIQRYENNGYMEDFRPEPKGEWVKYEDHVDAVESSAAYMPAVNPVALLQSVNHIKKAIATYHRLRANKEPAVDALKSIDNAIFNEEHVLQAIASGNAAPSLATPEAEGPRDIKRLVDRFLGWKLPENFNPDDGISFKKTFNDHLPVPMKHEPTGTNLFDASQAEAMLRYVLELDK